MTAMHYVSDDRALCGAPRPLGQLQRLTTNTRNVTCDDCVSVAVRDFTARLPAVMSALQQAWDDLAHALADALAAHPCTTGHELVLVGSHDNVTAYGCKRCGRGL